MKERYFKDIIRWKGEDTEVNVKPAYDRNDKPLYNGAKAIYYYPDGTSEVGKIVCHVGYDTIPVILEDGFTLQCPLYEYDFKPKKGFSQYIGDDQSCVELI